jgi:sterol desaturase/sphingolipid hydroxylase (fatty acid hydroxylase superfamily)
MGFRIPGTLVTGLVLVIGLVIFHWLERKRPMRREYRPGPGRAGYISDWIALIINGPFLSSLSKIGAYFIATSMPTMHTVLGDWPWLAQFALFLAVNDFARYWLHRWYHENDFLWRFHRVHHTLTEMDALSTFRVHVLEGILKYGVIIMPFHIFGIDRWVIILYTSIDILKGLWHHANFKHEIGSLNYLLNSPELHWWHHSVETRGHRANYGSIFSIWDWLFGTAYWPQGVWPGKIGINGMDVFPSDYVGMFASARLTDEQVIERAHAAHQNEPHQADTSPPTSENEHAPKVGAAPTGA